MHNTGVQGLEGNIVRGSLGVKLYFLVNEGYQLVIESNFFFCLLASWTFGDLFFFLSERDYFLDIIFFFLKQGVGEMG
jgi:hypothetical protein